ncbi:hypothetical protein Tcan_02483 [Toxocara canis]|uniref:Uncharacterized protein n=1 Tax=Toxocara canis TaxID=6265 RepID=A0A0B2UPD4_TOXCA|nr:hypothetical protein Tcan_02483 [Toxocara canis]
MQRITASKEQSVVRVAPGSDQWKYDMEVSGTFNDSDLNNKLLPMDELDSDLYDRVSYLNLMSQYEERERQRKFEEKESLRRLREELVFSFSLFSHIHFMGNLYFLVHPLLPFSVPLFPHPSLPSNFLGVFFVAF